MPAKVAQDFLSRIRTAQSKGDLSTHIADATQELGFQHFALAHHTDLGCAAPEIILINNYPCSWVEHFIAHKLHRHDPVMRSCLCTGIGFAWSNMGSMIRLTPFQRAILEGGERAGLGEGFTVPAHVPGELAGSCSFVTRRGLCLPGDEVLCVAQLIGAFAFEAARRLSRRRTTSAPIVPLAPRLRECVLLAALGKTDWEIATILSLKPSTVHTYMGMLFRRYGVHSRSQAVVCALYDGQIGFTEVLH